FTRTKHGANRLAEHLGRDGIQAMAIHGNKSQGARTRALGAFRDGTLPVLVATDIAARGVDIDQLPQVVNYELPNVAEDYVHRIGRTGRAGSPGSAITLVEPEERKLLAGVERLLGRPIPRVDIPGHTGWSGKPETEPEHPGEARARTGQRPPRSPGSARGGAPGHAGGGRGRGAAPARGGGRSEGGRGRPSQGQRAVRG